MGGHTLSSADQRVIVKSANDVLPVRLCPCRLIFYRRRTASAWNIWVHYQAFFFLAGVLLTSTVRLSAQMHPYDPMILSDSEKVEIIDLTVNDDGRDREIPIRVYISKNDAPAPVVLFSHGLGGS